MNITSLLLTSALTVAAVSGARAADAVVIAEPEPMEYVRICDVYGTGFYYIPGTETCLRVGGYVRYDIGLGDLFGVDLDADGEGDTYYKRARAALQIDARSETELGTLRSYMHTNFNFDRTAAGVSDGMSIDHAYIELGGFRVGKTDSLFVSLTNFAGNVVNDDLIDYEPDRTHQIAYTYTGTNGFMAAIGVEEGAGAGHALDSYTPHVVGGASLTQGWGGVSGAFGYDSVVEEWAGKVRLDVKPTPVIAAFVMVGLSTTDTGSYYATWDGDWAVWGGASLAVTDKATVNVQLSYDDSEAFAAVANVDYKLVQGLTITPEIGYYDSNLDEGDDGSIGGFVRIQRGF